MEQKQNVLAVTDALVQKLAEITPSLPEGVEIVTTYDRSTLIWGTLEHYFATLISELIIVILVTALFLRNPRTVVAPVAVLLLGVLYTFMPLAAFNQTINLFSLAGLFIAIGEMVDATIVIVENCTAELAARPGASPAERRQIILRSITNVARPLFFSLLIILASFLPVFFLGEKEGRMFDPLAFSKTFAMAFSTVLTLVVLPLLIVWVFKKGDVKPQGTRELAFVDLYRRGVRGAIRHRYAFLGRQCRPADRRGRSGKQFQEGLHAADGGGVHPLYADHASGRSCARSGLDSSADRQEARRLSGSSKSLRKVGQGRYSDGLCARCHDRDHDPPQASGRMAPGHDEGEARRGDGRGDEDRRLCQHVGTADLARVVMQDTGIQTPVGIKIKGNDIAMIEDIGRRVETALRAYPGTQSVIAERISSGYFIDVQFDPVRLASAGISADEAMPIVRYAIGGDNVVGIKEPNATTPVPLSVQYSPEYLNSLEKVRNTPVVVSGGSSVTLGEIADVRVRNLPEMIRNDNGTLAGYVYVYLTNDVSPTDYVTDAQPFLAQAVDLPTGYSLEWTGDYQYSLKRSCAAAVDHPRDACDHLCPAAARVSLCHRQLADHAVGAVRIGRRCVPPMGSRLLDDHRSRHRIHRLVRDRHPDWHHHDRFHPAGARAQNGRPKLCGRRG